MDKSVDARASRPHDDDALTGSQQLAILPFVVLSLLWRRLKKIEWSDFPDSELVKQIMISLPTESCLSTPKGRDQMQKHHVYKQRILEFIAIRVIHGRNEM